MAFKPFSYTSKLGYFFADLPRVILRVESEVDLDADPPQVRNIKVYDHTAGTRLQKWEQGELLKKVEEVTIQMAREDT
jgi:hypothetical protein